MPSPSISVTKFNFARSYRNTNPNYLCVIERAQRPGEAAYLTVVGHLPSEFSMASSSAYSTPFSQAISDRVPPQLASAASAAGIQLVTQALTAQVWQGSSPLEMSLDLHFHVESDPITDVVEPVLSLQKLVTPSTGSVGGAFFRSPGPQLDYQRVKELLGQGVDAVSSSVGNAKDAAAARVKKAASDSFEALGDAFLHPVDALKSLVSPSSPGEASKGQLPDQSNQSVGGQVLTFAENQLRSVDSIAATLDRKILGAVSNNITITIGRFLRFSSVVITSVNPSWRTLPLEDGSLSYCSVNITFQTFLTPTEADLVQMYLTRGSKNKSSKSTPSSVPTIPVNQTSRVSVDTSAGTPGKSAVSIFR